VAPEIYSAIDRTKPGINEEVQLTDAFQLLAHERPVYAATISGTRYDIGDRYLWIKANLEFAMRSPELRERLRPEVEAILKREKKP
jgi:UTP--glucose-1-phosphate uridylyltransferase